VEECHFDSMHVPVTEEVAAALDDVATLISEAAFGAIKEKRTAYAFNPGRECLSKPGRQGR
jgi:hypothetical protein